MRLLLSLYLWCVGHRWSRRRWQSLSGFRTTTSSCQPTCMEVQWSPTIPSTGPEILAFEGGPCMRPRRTTNSLERFTFFFSILSFFFSCVDIKVNSDILCVCLWGGSWRGPTHTPTAGCTTAGTAGTSSMRASPMEPAGTLCPEVCKICSRKATVEIKCEKGSKFGKELHSEGFSRKVSLFSTAMQSGAESTLGPPVQQYWTYAWEKWGLLVIQEDNRPNALTHLF